MARTVRMTEIVRRVPEARPGDGRWEILQDDPAQNAKLQTAFRPAAGPTIRQYDLAVLARHEGRLCRDFHEFVAYPDGRIALILATAHGGLVSGALVSAIARAALISRPARLQRPTATLRFLNDHLLQAAPRGHFMSLAYALLDPATHRLEIARVGHLPVLIWRTRARRSEETRARGPVLGACATSVAAAQFATEETRLDHGDRMVMYTHEFDDPAQRARRRSGLEALRARLGHDADLGCAEFLRAAAAQLDRDERRRGSGPDQTLVALRRCGS